MVDTRPAQLTRKLLGQFLKDPETIKAFENLSLNSGDFAEVISQIQSAAVLVLSLTDGFTDERVVSSDGEVQLTDGGPGGNFTFGLSNTGVSASSYGGAAQTVQLAINAKGRITLAQAYALNSDNVAEGGNNLYFTQARARNALSSGTGISYNSATGAISVSSKLAAYDGGDTPSAFTLSIVDSVDPAAWRAAIGAGTSSTTGTVTSIDVSGGATGLTFSGGPVTTNGTITMAGTLAVANGGTEATTAAGALANLGAVSTARSIATGAGLVGGGNLTADRTLSLATSGVTAGSYGSATKIPTITLDVYGRATIASENTIPALAAGTYTPTLTPTANVSAATAYACQYLRVGNTVTVSGKLDMTIVANTTNTLITISVPVNSAFAATEQAGGTGYCAAVSGLGGAILAYSTNVVSLNFMSNTTGARTFAFSFIYQIV